MTASAWGAAINFGIYLPWINFFDAKSTQIVLDLGDAVFRLD